jgi:hypothetical protein
MHRCCLLVHTSSVASHFRFSVINPACRHVRVLAFRYVTFGCVEANVPNADEQRACLGHSKSAEVQGLLDAGAS